MTIVTIDHSDRDEYRELWHEAINNTVALAQRFAEARAQIDRLRAALQTARDYIADQQVAHAIVIPRGDTIHEGTDLSRYPTLLQVMDRALGNVEQEVDGND
jgi:hypothetical protein